MGGLTLRRPKTGEHSSVKALVQAVVDEVYGGVWAPPPLPLDDEDWSLAWVAVSGAKIVGVVLTHGEWISDLWVLREYRDKGIGRQLLLQAEAEMAGRGHLMFRLRVVKSNAQAVSFYKRIGWRVEREFPHEKLPIDMLEMVKSRATHV
ncbi:MAG: GNAT family N-acetyltransferase [Bryobacteraceae bacterium]